MSQIGMLARRYRNSHSSIDVVDDVSAASGRVHRANVWTPNVKHVPLVESIYAPY